jgi:hypothetical protein
VTEHRLIRQALTRMRVRFWGGFSCSSILGFVRLWITDRFIRTSAPRITVKVVDPDSRSKMKRQVHPMSRMRDNFIEAETSALSRQEPNRRWANTIEVVSIS